MDKKYIFLNTLEDIREKLKGEKYHLIRACGLLRHLLLDGGNSLYHQLCREFGYDRKILFTAHNLKHDPMVNKGTLLLWERLIPFNDNSKKFNLDDFLGLVCLHYMFQEFTIKDIIRVCSHVLGGIHTGDPKNESEKLLNDWFQESQIGMSGKIKELEENFEFIIGSDEMAFQTIRDICVICLEALKPYEEKAKV